ncbi:MAG: metal-sulfur cluster assembly factor [Burkholderiales bacterium]|nr:metal-sulfur cluster assembly factor [Burkholderiales bacterium]
MITPAAPHPDTSTEPAPRFDYSGDPAWQEPITEALRRVIDPEMALSIVDIGLVYRVAVLADRVQVAMTMTSAACPVADLLVSEVEAALDALLPVDLAIQVELVWEPAWTPERMSPDARRFMRW